MHGVDELIARRGIDVLIRGAELYFLKLSHDSEKYPIDYLRISKALGKAGDKIDKILSETEEE